MSKKIESSRGPARAPPLIQGIASLKRLKRVKRVAPERGRSPSQKRHSWQKPQGGALQGSAFGPPWPPMLAPPKRIARAEGLPRWPRPSPKRFARVRSSIETQECRPPPTSEG